MIRPHLFMRDFDGPGCRYCPLPKKNSRYHLEQGAFSTPDITEPARRPDALAAAGTQPMLPKPRTPRGARKAKAKA